MIKKLFAWLLNLKLLKLRTDTFFINKKTNQISFSVPNSIIKQLGNFKPVFADVYFTRERDTFK